MTTAKAAGQGKREHFWISNTALERATGIRRVCLDCGLALDRGQRLSKDESYCPGKLGPV